VVTSILFQRDLWRQKTRVPGVDYLDAPLFALRFHFSYNSDSHSTDTTTGYNALAKRSSVDVTPCMYRKRFLRPMSHLQFYRATLSRYLSRDKIASVTWHVAQLFNSRATHSPNRAVLYCVQHFCENAVNADWSILVYATKLQCATCKVAY